MRRWWAVLLAPGLWLAVAACAGESDLDLAGSGIGINTDEDDDRTPAAPDVPADVGAAFDAAIEATRSVDTARLRLDAALEAPGRSVDTGLEGELGANGAGHVVADVRGEGTEIELELLTDSNTLLVTMDLPRFQDALPEGAEWVEVPPDRLEDVVPAVDLGQVWPVLAVLRGVDEVEDLGVEDIDGTPVRMLRGDVDPQAALAEASPDEQESMETMVGLPGDLQEMVAEVGLDGDGRVRFLEVTVTVSGPNGEQATATTGLEVRDVNHVLDLPPSPADDEVIGLADVPEIEDLLTDLP